MMLSGDVFDIRERSGSDAQPHPLVPCTLRRIKLFDGTSLRAWP